jgi:CCR4-NOT transcription complex subunit 1
VQQILKNPDVFCFADYPFHSVAVDILKAPPESDNKEITTWRSLDLVETLLYLSDRGLYSQVQEMFKLPIQHCPDVLVLALLQINPPVTVLRQELLTNLIPIFLGNHPNSAIILHHAWHSQVQYITCCVMDWPLAAQCEAVSTWATANQHHLLRYGQLLSKYVL